MTRTLAIILVVLVAVLAYKLKENGEVDAPVVLSVNEVHVSIAEFFAQSTQDWDCGQLMACGNVVKVSCTPQLDGPIYYFDNSIGEGIVVCGFVDCSEHMPGFRRENCSVCPPVDWTCGRASSSL